jgi:hypothetical protein
MTYAEYVAAEASSETKHEWLRGEVFAMAGGTPERIEVHRLNEAGRWELHEAGAGESLELASIGCRLSVDDVYRDPLAAL